MQEQKRPAQYYYEEIDLMDYVRVLMQRKKVFAVVFAAVVVLGTGATFLMPKVYEAESVIRTGEEMNGIDLARIEAEIESGLYGEELSAEAVAKAGVLKIRGRSQNPEELVRTLNTTSDKIVEDYQDVGQEKEEATEQEIASLEEELAFLKSRGYAYGIADLRIRIENLKRQLELTETASLEVARYADLPQTPEKPNVKLNFSISFVLALFTAVFASFFVHWWKENKSKLKN